VLECTNCKEFLERDEIWLSHLPSGHPLPNPPPRGGREQKDARSLPSPSGGGAGGRVLAQSALQAQGSSSSRRVTG
jgi:hypothetical protein